MKMHKFPLFIDLSGRKILIVGAGSIAFRRVNTLLMYGADVTVVAPKICDNINDLARDGKITLLSRQFCREDVSD
jgi:siroheme synthase-like protein